jgi:hypothetical protein
VINRERLIQLVLYDPITGRFVWRYSIRGHIKQGYEAGCLDQRGYWVLSLDGNHYLAHRVAWFWVYNEWPKGEIGHINLERSDNRIDNLRDVSHSINQHNGRPYKNNKSKLKGVTYLKAKKKWMAQIQRDKKHFYLGLYKTAQKAHCAYCRAAEKHYGKFARTQ